MASQSVCLQPCCPYHLRHDAEGTRSRDVTMTSVRRVIPYICRMRTHTHTHIAHLLMARVKLSSQCRTKARVTLYAICRVRCAAYSSCPRQIHASTRTPPIHLLLISLYCLGGLTQKRYVAQHIPTTANMSRTERHPIMITDINSPTSTFLIACILTITRSVSGRPISRRRVKQLYHTLRLKWILMRQ